MRSRQDKQRFSQIWVSLPSHVKENYQGTKLFKLFQMVIQFIVTLWDVRRGCEGLRELTKLHYDKYYEPESKTYVHAKIRGEVSKNHKSDIEELANSSISLL